MLGEKETEGDLTQSHSYELKHFDTRTTPSISLSPSPPRVASPIAAESSLWIQFLTVKCTKFQAYL